MRRRRRTDDRGATVWVAYIVFFPVYMAAILLLVEATHLQALKNVSDIVTHTASNAAVRQADYQALLYDPATGTASERVLLRDDTSDDLAILGGLSDLSDPGVLDALVRGPMADTSTATIDTLDMLSAQAVGEIVYRYNADRNGLASGAARTSPVELDITVHNTESWGYRDYILRRDRVASWPGIVVTSSFRYVPLPMFIAFTANTIQEIDIGSQTVSQLVPSRSSDRSR
ncbi:MAG: hypothetical protein Q7U75_14795 [Desulfobacterales bacterium]|nr:hypothetical protein [Desulfobacterales bacterium]